MSSSTSWSFDGIDLATFGEITLLNDYLDMPSKRGENQVIPFRHGSRFVEKYYGERVVTFGIAIKRPSAILLEQTLDDLKKLLAKRQEKILSNTRADESVRTISVSVEGETQIQRESYNFLRAVIIFKSSSPFFRSTTVTADNEITVDASPKSMPVDNIGTAVETDPVCILTGPLENVVITNPSNNCILEYIGSIPSPRVVTIQTLNGQFIATDDLSTNVIGNIRHHNSQSLMEFDSGLNSLQVESDVTTTGKVKFVFYPPFM